MNGDAIMGYYFVEVGMQAIERWFQTHDPAFLDLAQEYFELAFEIAPEA